MNLQTISDRVNRLIVVVTVLIAVVAVLIVMTFAPMAHADDERTPDPTTRVTAATPTPAPSSVTPSVTIKVCAYGPLEGSPWPCAPKPSNSTTVTVSPTTSNTPVVTNTPTISVKPSQSSTPTASSTPPDNSNPCDADGSEAPATCVAQSTQTPSAVVTGQPAASQSQSTSITDEKLADTGSIFAWYLYVGAVVFLLAGFALVLRKRETK